LLDLLLKAAGLEPGKPIPAEVQEIIDDQVSRVIEQIAVQVTERLLAELVPQTPTTQETYSNVDSSAEPQ
jgi:hypothetical protein